jgi:acylphosphatase
MEKKNNNRGIKARVYGRVQGVGFRYSTVIQARKTGVSGYVRNMPDGTVEVVAEGAEDRLKKLVSWLKKGPPVARVDNVDVHYIPYNGYYNGFGIDY